LPCSPRMSNMKRLTVSIVLLGLLAAACGTARTGGIGPSLSDTPSSSPSMRPSNSPPPTPSPRPSYSMSPHPIQTKTPEPPPPIGQIPVSLMGTQWYKLPTSKRVVALTFDAGANADGIPSILATLAETGVPATFFLTGKWVEVYPEYSAEIGAKFPVGSHSYSHPDFTTLTDAEIESELSKAAAAIESATGLDPHPMFRFPFGASNDHCVDLVNSLGYGAINWTVDTRGWQGTSGGQSVDLILNRVLDGLQPGEIVIMHVGSNPDDGSTLDADALPRMIEELSAAGYTFVTIDQYL
jgi:peptidoglycan/xylan/chitin deacetylase (PgdA/CDA1 family)/predicted small secreted protein